MNFFKAVNDPKVLTSLLHVALSILKKNVAKNEYQSTCVSITYFAGIQNLIKWMMIDSSL